MKLYEMEGFLRGKCLPGDLLVGESNAAYLVRKLNEAATIKDERDALEIRLRNALSGEQEAIQRAHAANQTADALAVENAALKDVFGSGEAVVNFLSIALRHTKYDCIDLPDVALAFKMSLPETPATDAALATIEMRAKAEAIEQLAIQLGQLPDDAFDVLSDAAEFETYQEEHHTFVSISNPRAVANAVISLVKEQSDELREAK
ncbi:hypothetical protein JY466_08505 [Serratia marcescens]|nr:hypothetical protein [Serratia marcescens]MBN5194671.1 hypothetical protein [Serratia marcescens]